MSKQETMITETRTEYDSMGSVEVPASALYGAQTQRALNNFTISAAPMPEQFIRSMLIIKMAAAEANRFLGLLVPDMADAIVLSSRKLLDEGIGEHFPVPVLQTGSGTSTNMNVNEVLSQMARNAGTEVSPNDHVNMGQSSNDVIPSALHLSTALQIVTSVKPALSELASMIRAKAAQHKQVVKTGRTHLMDALPVRLHREMEGWAGQVEDCISRLDTVLPRLKNLPLGGTAVGSAVNCHPEFAHKALEYICNITDVSFQKMDSAYKGLSSIDTALEASGHLKTAACVLMKISNDLRWMNSGPGSGLAEIVLPALQPGSSIMPDKINPVIPEAVCMAASQVIGNDTTITIAAQSGNFQLNTMLPLTAARLLESGELISGSARILGEKAIKDLQVNEEKLKKPLATNPILATALTPYIGYLEAAKIAKKARETKRTILEVAREETGLDSQLLETLLDPAHLADGGVLTSVKSSK